MKFIKLPNGRRTYVSDEDFAYLKKWKWSMNKDGYVFRNQVKGEYPTYSKRKKFYMHRLLVEAPANVSVDHIDHNRLNNQRSNLRLCVGFSNQWNRRKNNTYAGNKPSSRFKGVYKINDPKKKRNIWQAHITYKGVYHTIGAFPKEHWAAMAYDIWAKELYGEFASTNC